MNDRGFSNSASDRFSEKARQYSSFDRASRWLKDNIVKVKSLFTVDILRDFIFEPVAHVFSQQGKTDREKILSVILQVSVANAIIVSLPGKLGVGVYVSISLELWMAYTIARATGNMVEKMSDVFRYMGATAAVAASVLVLFKQVLGLVFSLFSVVGFLPATMLSELVVTNFFGVLFWVGFEELSRSDRFRIPSRLWIVFTRRFKEVFSHQKSILKNLLTMENIKLIGERLKGWFSGDLNLDSSGLRGEVFAFAAMAYLIEGRYAALEGPMGLQFMESVRRCYPSTLGNANVEEMQEFFSSRTSEELAGDVNLIKGDMFEGLVEKFENADGDEWSAQLHESRSEPGSDILFTNINTGEQIEVSLKCTDNPALIEHALDRYPEIPILTTAEMENHFGDNPYVRFSNLSNEDLEKVTADNVDALTDMLDPVIISGTGVAAKTAVTLWPFVVAYARKRITHEQLKRALQKSLGEAGVSLASRITYTALLGMVFSWFLLYRSVIAAVSGAEKLATKRRVLVEA